jgi:alpha-glucosidase (family GH31 glycosyl hydrolase)
MFVDVEATPAGPATQWVAEAGALYLFLLPGPTPSDVAAQYASLTGPTAMPQMFAIGYHQCRRGGGVLRFQIGFEGDWAGR